MTRSTLDPRTAYVSFRYEDLGGNVGRVYYWYDPAVESSGIDDWDFRAHHPEIHAAEWDRLFYEAFDRSETEFERQFGLDPSAHPAFGLGRLFGPRKPAPSR